ncbi:hypothetical protein SAMN02799630_02860 [Paenibacillus sp. UNCCL117]|uniref:hypothetical protein n=1 Tax=unclassified Paenibacillus TaxID=185978 RepID=UPI00087E43DD|nr:MULTISPECIES: hypothetical protein [unclassified Paenibacillus]SDD27690.1 hypothetical protein SAMN04488602_107131 [Paenibacillus sp. cl123]SFW41043.1 hypothetical protein SAMN02799630_02860 [Paenibacillus sp. UNCCL117]
MKIQVEDDLYIEDSSTGFGFVIKKYAPPRFDEAKGQDVTTHKIIANFQSLPGCVSYILHKHNVSNSCAADLKALTQEIRKQEALIKNLFEKSKRTEGSK